MANHLRGTLISQLRIMLATRNQDKRSDEQLLNQFIATRDEGAFTVLVARYGNAVWDVCHDELKNVADAEDAFQRTFMLLAQRAGLISSQKTVRAWLIGAARRECWSVRRTLLRQKTLLQKAKGSTNLSDNDGIPPLMQDEIASVLRQEVACLPESLRVPLVHRYLENKTLNEIAFVLGCTDRAVAKRLIRGESLLRKRLARRGMSAGCVGLGGLLGSGRANAAVSPRLMENTIRAALSAPPAAGWLGSIPGLCGRLLTSRLGLGLVVLAGLIIAGGVYGLMRGQAPAAPPSEQPRIAEIAPNTAPPADQNHKDVTPADEAPNVAKAVVQDPGPTHSTAAVSGQVVDPAGKPIPDARVAILRTSPVGAGRRIYHDDLVMEGDCDPEGRYRLNIPTDLPTDLPGMGMVKLVVYAPGRGLATAHTSLIAHPVLPALSLEAEKPIQGRVLEPEGKPAVGVRVSVVRVGHIICQDAADPKAANLPPHWPEAAITDKDGRYVISGLGRREVIHLVINDDRYGPDNILIEPGRQGPADIQLQAPRIMRGRLVAGDNRKPLAGVRVTRFFHDGGEFSKNLAWSSQVTDAAGQFRLPLEAGYPWYLEFAAPDGMPYLSTIQPCPKDVNPGQEFEFTLPEAVLLSGRVTDASTNKPLADVTIQYLPARRSDPAWRPFMIYNVEIPIATDKDGRFSLAVSRAGGHLLMHAQQDDYRVVAADEGFMLDGTKTGKMRHAHAIVPIDAAGSDPKPDLKIELRRGISIKGAIVKPDGEPVNGGYLICRRRVWSFVEQMRPVVVTEQGTFSLDGCDPERAERVLYMDPTGKYGAVADLVPPAKPTDTVTIHAERCGVARFSLLDAEGNPMPDVNLKLMVCLPEPGAVADPASRAERKSAHIICVPVRLYLPKLVTDLHGQVLLPYLVPGAEYRITDKTENLMVTESFRVSPGEKLEGRIQPRKPGQ